MAFNPTVATGPHPDDVMLWPDGTWCHRSELAEYSFMSDDYQVLSFHTFEWQQFIESDAAQ